MPKVSSNILPGVSRDAVSVVQLAHLARIGDDQTVVTGKTTNEPAILVKFEKNVEKFSINDVSEKCLTAGARELANEIVLIYERHIGVDA